MSAVPLGTLAAGLAVDLIGLRQTGRLLAAWCLVALVIRALPALRSLDTGPVTPASIGPGPGPGPGTGSTTPGQGSETADTTSG
ncbi:hypothetical protein QBA38_23360 [Streptomyces stelliscabiei]|uniref:hypothetical protein n=1 Tax=Streptomyces stelliscabiei TaxID=146820 RepID=UPI002FEF520B